MPFLQNVISCSNSYTSHYVPDSASSDMDYFGRPHEAQGLVNARRAHVSVNLLALIPIDVMFEVFKYLHPSDLLHLARTSYPLRHILMSRISKCVWRASLANVDGLPFCPSDLSEPQYASLAFDTHCHFCLARNVQQVYWACRVRCCDKCFGKKFVPDFILEQRFPKCLEIYRRDAIFPYIVNPRMHNRNKLGRIFYYLPAAETYIKELDTISCCDSAVMRWSTQKSLEQDARIKHAKLCETWYPSWVYSRSPDINLIIVPFLIVLLIFLWRERILNIYAPSPPKFLH